MNKSKTLNLADTEVLSGILLIMSFLAASFIANIPALQNIYQDFVFYSVHLGLGNTIYTIPLIQIINDGLMTLFFLLIGLELKFHLVKGEFQEKRALILPTAAAFGGVVVPALIYAFFNMHSKETVGGWAIPIATDTAFMLGILSFFGNFISQKLRAFIIGFSLIDDAFALIILAVFYSKSSSIIAMIATITLTALLFTLNRLNITKTSLYLMIGFFLWVAMVYSGIHGTLSGVVLALAFPLMKGDNMNDGFHELESFLKPMVYFFILPLFSFINSGVSFTAVSPNILFHPIALGVIFGLFIGKQLGISLFSYLAVQSGYCSLPKHVSWPKFYGIGVLGGIGFTLSLFIGDITFEEFEPNYIMRLSVIIGSLLSAILGAGILLLLKEEQAS
ncbi:MAG: Na+/H+ antiporter NhaA [Gammaproteobacteria bacterium]|nr:Na+/H+ antiporter NhaA [Gammaproteobacteria bacterium]